jgi:hypothetical protein
MTFSLRRKHPTIPLAKRWLTLTAISSPAAALALALGLSASPALAQSQLPGSVFERSVAPPWPNTPILSAPRPDAPAAAKDAGNGASPVALRTDSESPPAQAPDRAAQFGSDKYTAKSGVDALQARTIREVPSTEVLMRIESEEMWKQRVIQENLNQGDFAIFPAEPTISKSPYPARNWGTMTKLVEPAFVVHGRLLFEQQNFERGGWNLGILQPMVESGKFLFDVAALPYHLGTRPFQQYDTSAGKCLPGDPAPFYLYPIELSLTGLAAEGAAVTGILFMFP